MTYATVALLGLAAGLTLHWLSLPLIGSILGAGLGVSGALYHVKAVWAVTNAVSLLSVLDAAFLAGAIISCMDWRSLLGHQS